MRQVTETKTIYTFDELPTDVQKKLIEEESKALGEDFNYDYVDEDAERVAEILGISFGTRSVRLMNGNTIQKPEIYWSGFWSQGDGASFVGSYEYARGCKTKIREYAPKDETLHQIADELTAFQKVRFYQAKATITKPYHQYQHENTMALELDMDNLSNSLYSVEAEEELLEIMRKFARWIYRQLEKEYDHQTSEQTCRDYLKDNGAEYTKDGEVFVASDGARYTEEGEEA